MQAHISMHTWVCGGQKSMWGSSSVILYLTFWDRVSSQWHCIYLFTLSCHEPPEAPVFASLVLQCCHAWLFCFAWKLEIWTGALMLALEALYHRATYPAPITCIFFHLICADHLPTVLNICLQVYNSFFEWHYKDELCIYQTSGNDTTVNICGCLKRTQREWHY